MPLSSEGDSNIFSVETRNLADVSVQALEILEEPDEVAGYSFQKPTSSEYFVENEQNEEPPKSTVQLLVENIEKASVIHSRQQTQKTEKTERTEEIKPVRTQATAGARSTTYYSQKPLLVEVKRKSRYDDWVGAETMQPGIQLQPSQISAATTIK